MTCCSPSSSTAMCGSNTKAFHANRPPGRSALATRSKTRRRSAQVGRWRSARNGQIRRSEAVLEGEVAHVAFAEIELDASLRPRARERLRASPVTSRSRSPRFPVLRRWGIATGRFRPRARRPGRRPRAPARRRSRRPLSCRLPRRRRSARTRRRRSCVPRYNVSPRAAPRETARGGLLQLVTSAKGRW